MMPMSWVRSNTKTPSISTWTSSRTMRTASTTGKFCAVVDKARGAFLSSFNDHLVGDQQHLVDGFTMPPVVPGREPFDLGQVTCGDAEAGEFLGEFIVLARHPRGLELINPSPASTNNPNEASQGSLNDGFSEATPPKV